MRTRHRIAAGGDRSQIVRSTDPQITAKLRHEFDLQAALVGRVQSRKERRDFRWI